MNMKTSFDVDDLIAALDRALNDDYIENIGNILSINSGENVTKERLFNLIRLYTSGKVLHEN